MHFQIRIFRSIKQGLCEEDFKNILTCGLKLKILGVMLIIFFGLPFEPIPGGRHEKGSDKGSD